MAVFNSQLLTRWRYLSLASRPLGGGLLARKRTKLPAGGTELTGHRDYAPGDGLCRVDWNLCARHDELLVRQFQGEADYPVYFLLDASRSMALGRPSKFDVARQITAALGYVALADLDPVAVSVFSDSIVADLPPLRHTTRIVTLARFLEGLSPRREPTSLAVAAGQFGARRQRRGLVVVVGDLYDLGLRRALGILTRCGYQPRVVHLYDPRDAAPDCLGDSELVDVETGARWQTTLRERHLAEYRRRYAEFYRSVRTDCAASGVRCVQVPVDLPPERLLLTVLRASGGAGRQDSLGTDRLNRLNPRASS
ncbi:MAG: DUF58 domain-containing protein [Planctomycetota bacterium]|jgi:uncharacterized protein (DUF58 family)